MKTVLLFFISILSINYVFGAEEIVNIFAPVDKRSSEITDQKPAPKIDVSAFEVRGAISAGKYKGLMVKIKDKKYLAETGGKENIVLKKGEKIGEYTFNRVEGYHAVFRDKDNETIKVPLLTLSSSKTAVEAVKAEKVVKVDTPVNQNTGGGTTATFSASIMPKNNNIKNTAATTPVKKDYMPRANDNSTKNIPKTEPSEGVKKFIDIIKQQQQQRGGTTPGQNPFLNMFNK